MLTIKPCFLFLIEMCVKYSVLKEEDKYEIASAAHLG